MSGFEDNPFGEPMVDNPFADSAIQQARAKATQNAIVILDDYKPFEDDGKPTTTGQQQHIQPPTFSEANLAGQMQPQIPPYNNQASSAQANQVYGAAPQISTAELQRRQEELERKAAELERREEQLRNNTNGSVRRNNWPPLPEKCCFQPCFYQDINVEIPSEFQKIVRQLYYLWMFYALIMCANVFGGLLLMFHNGAYEQFGLAILYAFLFTPASFLCWYRPAYKAFRTDSSFNFMVFFFIFFFQMLMLIIQTIGFHGSGYCGFVTAISLFNASASGIIVGLVILSIAIAFGVCAAGNFMLLTKIHAIYRHSESVSLGKAQAEFTNEFIHNQHVQRAAANATAAAVSSQFSSPTNRY